MNYIQNKLEEFHHKFCEFTDGGVLVHYCKDGNCLDEFITQILTDYHNHIVESLERMKIPTEEMIHDLRGKCDFERNNTLNEILSLLQDTNPKE